MAGPSFEEGFVGATIATDEGGTAGDAFDASTYSFFGGGGGLDGGLEEELEVGLEAPPEEEELEGGIDYLDAGLEDIGDDEDLSLAALISGTDSRALEPPPPPPIPSAQLTAGARSDAVNMLAKPSGSIALGGLLTAGSGFYTPSPPSRSFGGRTVIGADLSSLSTPPLGGLPSEPASLSRFGRPEIPTLPPTDMSGQGLYSGYGQPPHMYPPAPAGLSAGQLEAALLARSAQPPAPPHPLPPPQLHQGHQAPGIMLGPVRGGPKPPGPPGFGPSGEAGFGVPAPMPHLPSGFPAPPAGFAPLPTEGMGMLVPPGPQRPPLHAPLGSEPFGAPPALIPGRPGSTEARGPSPLPPALAPAPALDQQDFPVLGAGHPAPPRRQNTTTRSAGLRPQGPQVRPPLQRRGIDERLQGLSLNDRPAGQAGHGRGRGSRRDSAYMSADEIDQILYSQMRGLQQGPAYAEDYYFQGFVYKYYNRRNRASFAPEAVRELAPTEKAGAGEVEFVHLEGLGRVPFSNIRRPRPLMEQAEQGPEQVDPGSTESKLAGAGAAPPRRRLGDEPALAARIMIEDCAALVLDVLDIDAIFVASGGRPPADEAALRARRGLLLDGLAASLRLSLTPGQPATPGTPTDPVLRRLMALPKGRTLAARALRVTFSPVGEAGGPANLRLLWAVLRGAGVLFGAEDSGGDSLVAAELTAASARVAAAAAGTILMLPRAADVADAATALVAGAENGQLPLLAPPPRVAKTAGAPLSPPLPWLADVMVALARRARDVGLLDDEGEQLEEGELEPAPRKDIEQAKLAWHNAATKLADALAQQRAELPANLMQAISGLLRGQGTFA